MKVEFDGLLERLQAGERWRPIRWRDAALLQDGYCHIKDHYTFVQHTPHTVSLHTSPVASGLRQAMEQFGDEWEEVPCS